MLPKLDIVIVNWNAGDYLYECVTSIKKAINKNFILSNILIVDNASIDSSLEKIETNGLPIKIIKNIENIGFAKASNQGAKVSNADYLLMLNPDTRLYENSLSAPIEFMEKEENKNIGIIGIQILNDKNEISRNCARFPSPISLISRSLGIDKLFPKIIHGHFISEWDHKENRIVDQVMGSFFLIRKKLFDELEGYDERFFVYYEDLDLALRARKKGYFSYYLSDAQFYHKGGGVTENVKAKRMFFNLQSKILFAQKHFNYFSYLLVAFVVLFFEPITRITFEIFKFNFKSMAEILRGYKMLWSDFILMKSKVGI